MGTASTGRLRRGWEYYRRYTKRRTGIHAAATAALTGFGLLAYFEQWFVAVAIAAYLLPPVYLYLTGDDLGDRDRFEHERTARRDAAETHDGDGIDLDSDSDGTDTDRDDGFDGDADADGADADADGADADADGVDIDFDG
jgi:hypothetical protein